MKSFSLNTSFALSRNIISAIVDTGHKFFIHSTLYNNNVFFIEFEIYSPDHDFSIYDWLCHYADSVYVEFSSCGIQYYKVTFSNPPVVG